MATKEELKQEFEEAFDDTAKKEAAERSLTTLGDAALVVWGDRETVIATGIRIKTMLPGGDKLSIPHALAAGQYAVATGLNPFRGEFYAFPDKKGNLNIVDGYKALTRWANDECPYDVQYREEELDAGEAHKVRAVIMRHDRKEQLTFYIQAGADFKTAWDLVTFSAVGVVKDSETKWPDGKPKDPPQGWTWAQVAEKRALKTALNMSHGMPTVAQLARKSWEVAGVLTRPEDWDGTEQYRTDEEKERLAAMQALERERQERWEEMTGEQRQAKAGANSQLLYGNDTDDPFGEVIEGEVVVVEPPKVPMTLTEALNIGLPKDAPKLKLKKGAAFVLAVRLDAKDLIEYLTKPSSYDEPTEENLKVQKAARLILEQWDVARSMVLTEEERKEVEPEATHVEEGETPPLF